MRRFRLWLFARILVLVVVSALPARAGGGGDAAAEAFVRALSEDFALSAARAQADPGAARDAVMAIFARAFDMRSMALSALPEAFRDRADAGYVAAYTDHMADAFVAETLAGGAGTTEILGSRVQGARLVLVGTRVISADGQRQSVEWYLTPVTGGYRVINAAVSGVLVTAEQARDFRPHLISGDMPGLMTHLGGGHG